jgi:hypothetical protein
MTRTTANPCVHKATKSELDSSDVYQFEEKQQQLQWEQVQLSIFMAVVCSTTTEIRKRYASLMWGHLSYGMLLSCLVNGVMFFLQCPSLPFLREIAGFVKLNQSLYNQLSSQAVTKKIWTSLF